MFSSTFQEGDSKKIKVIINKKSKKIIKIIKKVEKPVCCWCGHHKTQYWCPPYGMVCSKMCAELVGITKKVRYPEKTK